MHSFQAFAITAATLLTSSAALAAGVSVGHVKIYNSFGSTAGGEFRAVAQADFTGGAVASTGSVFEGPVAAAPGLWETFCLERSENITMGTSYRAYVNVETTASNSNYAGGNDGGYTDPLDPRTAYLYHSFITRTLTTSYNYGTGSSRVSDANALQTAIWFIEQESSSSLSGKALQLYNEANAAVNTGTWVGLGDVRVLNLKTESGSHAQDQLIMVPQPLINIPLPSGAAMAGVGLMLVGTKRRRK